MARLNAAERRERQEAAGIPESPVLTRARQDDDNPLLNLHVGGVLVREMLDGMNDSLAAIFLTGLSYQATDEGIAANNEGKSDLKVSVGAEGFEKALQQRRDDVAERGMEPYEARDPLKEAADAHARPGFRPKFLSARKVKENGGTGDYEVVKDPKTTEPVTVKGMVLGHIPEGRAKARNKHYQERSNRLLSEITNRYKQEGGPTAVVDQQ